MKITTELFIRKTKLLPDCDTFRWWKSLAVEADTALSALRVIHMSKAFILQRGRPANIRCDNGTEFISHKLQQWCKSKRVTLQYI